MGLSKSRGDGVSRLRPERGAKSPRESERGWGPASIENADRLLGSVLTRLSFSGLFLLTLLLSAAPAYAQATHLAVIVGLAGEPEHAELFTRWAGTLVDASAQAGGRGRDLPGREARGGREARHRPVDEGRGRQGVRQARRRRGRRRRLHRPHRPRDVRRQGGEVQPAGTGPDAGRFRAAAEEDAIAARGVREHGERQRAVHRGAGRIRPDDRDGDAHRRRAVRDAVWRLLRRRARGHATPTPTRTGASRCSRRSPTRSAKSPPRTSAKASCRPSMRS